MSSLNMLCFLIGFSVGSVATVIMVRYKQQKALKVMQQMNKSKSANFQKVNNATFVDVDSEVEDNE